MSKKHTRRDYEIEFVQALSLPTPNTAFNITQCLLEKENKYRDQRNLLFKALDKLRNSQEKHWSKKLIQLTFDPYALLFGYPGLQRVNNESNDLELFQSLCANWYKYLRSSLNVGWFTKKSHVPFCTFAKKTWEWIKAYLPIHLLSHTIEETRADIFSFPKKKTKSREKQRMIYFINQMCRKPVEWEDLEGIDDDIDLLNQLVISKGGWNCVPKKTVYAIMERAISLVEPQTIEFLLNHTPDLNYWSYSIWSSFIDFQHADLYDYPVSDRLIALWKVHSDRIHEAFDFMNDDFTEYPQIAKTFG